METILIFGLVTLLIPTGLIAALLSIFVCEKLGRDKPVWFILCLITGGLGLVILLVMGKDEETITKSKVCSGKLRICPNCAEAVSTSAKLCKHCRSALPEYTNEKAINHMKTKTYYDPRYAKRACTNCNQTIDKGRVHCFACDTINEMQF